MSARFKIEEVIPAPGHPPQYAVYRKEKIKWWWSKKWVRIGPLYRSEVEARVAVVDMAEHPQVLRRWYYDSKGREDMSQYVW